MSRSGAASRRESAAASPYRSMSGYTSRRHGPGVGSPVLVAGEALGKPGAYHAPVYWYPVPLGAPGAHLVRAPHTVLRPQFSMPAAWTPVHHPEAARGPGLTRSHSQVVVRSSAVRSSDGSSRAGSTEPKRDTGSDMAVETGDVEATSPRKAEEGVSRDGTPPEDTDTSKQPCEFFLRTGTCAYGSRCKFSHPVDKLPELRFNSLHLPLRPGEPICAFYAKHWRCSFGPTCKFHHPEPPFGAGQPSPFATAAVQTSSGTPTPALSPFITTAAPSRSGSLHSLHHLPQVAVGMMDQARDEQARHMPPSPFDRNNSLLLSISGGRGLKVSPRLGLQAQSSSSTSIYVPTPSQQAPQPIMVFRGSNSSLQSSGMVGSSYFVSGLVGLSEEADDNGSKSRSFEER